jgi:hypothetical protein
MKTIVILALLGIMQGNPFPLVTAKNETTFFNTVSPVTITGVLTDEIQRNQGQSEASYLFFRLDVKDNQGVTTSWAVKMPGIPPETLRACPLCLLNDYTPDMARLKKGMTITVKGYLAKDGSKRLLLIPSADPANIAGVVVLR